MYQDIFNHQKCHYELGVCGKTRAFQISRRKTQSREDKDDDDDDEEEREKKTEVNNL